MRDRMNELLKKVRKDCKNADCRLCGYAKFGGFSDCKYLRVADAILADGWMRPPCKVGDVVWYLNKHPHIALFQNSVYKAKVVRLVTISTGTVIVIQIKSEGCCEIPDESDWGITLFASREEAEKALKGGGQE